MINRIMSAIGNKAEIQLLEKQYMCMKGEDNDQLSIS